MAFAATDVADASAPSLANTSAAENATAANTSTAENTSVTAPTGPWVDSDTWYNLDGTSAFLNVRTGTVSLTPPDGIRNGRRRRSAASSGAWAVPFVSSPPPLLPPELLPRAESDAYDESMLRPEITSWGERAMAFSAPHAVNLARDGKPEHLPEDFTAYLARAWALHAEGMSTVLGPSSAP